MRFEVCKVHAHYVEQRGRKILPALQRHPIVPLNKSLKNELQHFDTSFVSYGRELNFHNFPLQGKYPALSHTGAYGVKVARPEKNGAT